MLGDGKTIDGITPLVSGETLFSGEDNSSSSSSNQDKGSISSRSQDKGSSPSNFPKGKTNSSENCIFIWKLMIIALALLF